MAQHSRRALAHRGNLVCCFAAGILMSFGEKKTWNGIFGLATAILQQNFAHDL